MGTYKGIQGYRVESLASDPGTISEVIGKVWYNSGSNVWKVAVEADGSWSAATVLNEARNIAGYSGTSNTSALIFGGNTDYPYIFPGKTEEFNGSTWTELANQVVARARPGSNGTATAALCFGGDPVTPFPLTHVASNEEWNGTSWTEKANLVTALSSNVGAGGPATTTAALCIGGGPEPSGQTTQIWDGTSWTNGGLLNIKMSDGQACGSSTAALTFGGSPTPRSEDTEEWNGTSWTERANASNKRVSGGGSGTSTSALQFGGYDSDRVPADKNTANVEKWNGTSWTEVANLGQTATNTGGCSTSSTATVKMGGYSGPPEIYYNFVEEWQDPVIGAKTITTS